LRLQFFRPFLYFFFYWRHGARSFLLACKTPRVKYVRARL
jgi:hypothetical protein